MPDPKKKTTAPKRPRSTAKSTTKAKAAAGPPADAPAPAKPTPKAAPSSQPLTSADILQRKREAQRLKAEAEGTTAASMGRGPAATQGRGPSGRTRGPVKK
jgi:hypothetical protein